MSYMISPEKLADWLEKSGEKIVIVDVRADLHDKDYGARKYAEDHLPGAHFLDLEKDLSGEVQEHGGNHPLPKVETFAEKLAEIGINNETQVVVYDDCANMFAPRAWFLLRHVGVEKVYVLDGGYEAWKEAGFDVTADIPSAKRVPFIPQANKDEIVSMADVKNRPDNVTLIDSRAYERYLGWEEPLYNKAGHIPGAVNYFWEDVIDENQRWKNDRLLTEHFKALSKDDTIIVSCGSGVSACANLLALRQIGYNNVKLYPGSFSDWISYEDNPIETKADDASNRKNSD